MAHAPRGGVLDPGGQRGTRDGPTQPCSSCVYPFAGGRPRFLRFSLLHRLASACTPCEIEGERERRAEQSRAMGSTEAMEGGGAGCGAAVLNCVDLSDPDVEKSVSLLKQACTDSGFFYVINHGISQDFMDEVFFQSKRLFALPMEEKMKLLRNEKHRGYTPILDEILDPDKQINGDYKEGYYIGVEVPDGDPQAEKPFYAPNLWPSEDLLPGWRRAMELFHQEALRVAKAVAKIIALALELEDDFFDRPEMLGEPIATLRLLHYEGKVSDPQKGIYGAGAHTDYGLITLLATDDVPGLQICKDKDAQPQIWEQVAPIKGGFIVNLGDMLERWSNCFFRSTLHRVLVNAEERCSVSSCDVFNIFEPAILGYAQRPEVISLRLEPETIQVCPRTTLSYSCLVKTYAFSLQTLTKGHMPT
ncbi:hypothetical protein Taro_035616 [Colocasia esculenta]|uniref:Fe2OG dioxygenase domain-containing protein n=1 Tax=Colocasia esculenta TaxID=4460 RepID=A0A843W770_COLES|nr:hypothetical protein [Colocasia esculenta]